MRIPRLYLDAPLQSGGAVDLPADRSHYLRTVLRLAPGAPVKVFNGTGGEYDAELIGPARRPQLAIHDYRPRDPEARLDVTLVQGMARGDRMDLAIQKATELGVRTIIPLETARGALKLTGERLDKRLAHWRGVAISACEQSGRTRLPTVAAPTSFDRLRESLESAASLADAKAPPGPWLVLSPTSPRTLLELAHPGPEARVVVLIGSEGGLTEAEETEARRRGFQAIALGPRILRTETAAVATVAGVLLLWGEGH